MPEVTGQQVKEAMTNAGIETVEHHACGLCKYMTKYVREGDALYFDPGCHCTGGEETRDPRSWESAADWINMQTREDVRERLSKRFGLTT